MKPFNYNFINKSKTLIINNNIIDKIKFFPEFYHVEELLIFNNTFTEIPKEIKNFYCIKKLIINYNFINKIPSEIGYLSSLEYLCLKNNSNLISLPLEIYKLKKLTYFSPPANINLSYKKIFVQPDI
jgi:Leucine-rich repeat (LRR) protein